MPPKLENLYFFLTLKVIALSLNCGAYYISFDDIQPYSESMEGWGRIERKDG